MGNKSPDWNRAPFSSNGVTEEAKNADLAIYLMDLLELQRDPWQGIWLADNNPLRSLSNTCQAVDAAHLLNLPQVSGNLVTPAIKWLVDLPLLRPLQEEEQVRVRIYPSRFKTLATLQRFEGPRLHAHFAELSTYLDIGLGLLLEVPVEDLKPPLRTMIWLDTLWHLARQGLDITSWQRGRDAASDAMRCAFENWLNASSSSMRFQITNDGDASYALDLLLRNQIVNVDSEIAQNAFERLLAAVRQRRSRVMRNADGIYCGIQLCQLFPHDRAAYEAVGAFLREIRERYTNHGYPPEQIAFHALVLRLLASFYGERLEELLFETNWMKRRAAADQETRIANQREEQELVKLLQGRFEIRIAEREELSSLRSRNQVFRIHFGFKTDAGDIAGHPMETGNTHLRLIIKRGPLLALTQAIQAYKELPDELKDLFVRHSEIPYPSSGDPMQPWYLVMEDLARWNVLGKELDRLEAAGWGRNIQEQLAQIVNAVATNLGAIHRTNSDEAATEDLERLYLNPLKNQVEQLSEPTAFPALKSFRLNGFEANNQLYRRLNSYLEMMRAYRRELAPTYRSMVHGDCHSRNLMISADLLKIKFIDLESVVNEEDYLADYALLIEDVAFYRFIHDTERASRLLLDEMQVAIPGDKSEVAENPIRHPKLQYSAFPVDSQVALSFQRLLLKQVESFANALQDKHWKERLWLAIARALLLLSTRQLQSRTLEQRRQSSELRIVLVSYAEAIRLIDELMGHFKSGEPLADVPFSGEHRAIQM